MWKRKILLLLLFLYANKSLARTNNQYNYRVEGRHQSTNRIKIVTTTPRPILQQYWQSFVRNLPTLPPLSWNITNPLGNLFNANSQQFIETPVVVHTLEEPDRKRTQTSKPKSSKKNKKRKGTRSRNPYSAYDNSYDSNYQQIHLQPLGLDQNRVMHFYEPSTGQYYALQVESQPNYYNSHYKNQYHHRYLNHHDQYNYNRYDDQHDSASNNEDQSYYTKKVYNSEYGYDADAEYDQQNYSVNNEYKSEYEGYQYEHEPDNDNNLEYDDGVELADNWGYSDDEIFADRKLKGESNNLNIIADRIIKIQKHLLKPETEEDVKILLSKDQNNADKNEEIAVNTETVENEIESVRNVLGTIKQNDVLKRKNKDLKAKKYLRIADMPRNHMEYYIFPTKFWL